MNPASQKLQHLLDDVMPTGGERCGPNRAALLAMVQRERSRRRRFRMASSVAAIAALALLFLWQPVPVEEPAVVTDSPAPLVIKQVNDQQLMALLQDTPAALMEWPDGSRTLLVVVR